MLRQDAQAFLVALGMAVGRSGAVDLFPGMKKLKRQNRKPVQDQPGRLGMEFGAGNGQVLPVEKVQQQHITLFGEIVAPLVGAGDEVREPLARFTRPFNTTGQPVVALPAPVPRGALPVGMQVVGRTNADTLRAALWLEREWQNLTP